MVTRPSRARSATSTRPRPGDPARRRTGRARPFGDKLGKKAAARLEKMGVEIQLNAMVVDLDYDGLVVKEKDGSTRRIESQCKVWSAGVQASPLGKQLAEQSGVELDRAGRVRSSRTCRFQGTRTCSWWAT